MKDVDLTQLPAFMLLRKSQQDKDDEKRAKLAGRAYDALDNQRQALLGLAARMGVTVPPENVVAEIKSGKLLKNRKDFLGLLDRIKALPKPGALLLTVNVARITRGLLTERGEIQDLFIDKQVLVATMQGITNLQIADQRLMYEFQGAMAHHYLLHYKEQVARTRAVQVEQGRLRTGSVPFGYLWNKETALPYPHPAEFPILCRVCREAFAVSVYVLARDLGLCPNLLYRALRSPMICGYPARTTGYRQGSGAIYILPREEWTWPLRQAGYPRAMEREDWDRLQVILDKRHRGGERNKGEDHWCRDVVRFPQMPGTVRLGGYKAPGAAFPTYVTYAERGGPKLYVRRSTVHDAVVELIRPVFQSPLYLQRFDEMRSQAATGPSTDEAQLQGEYDRLLGQVRNLGLLISSTECLPEEAAGYREDQARLREEAKRIGAQIRRIQSKVPMLSKPEAGLLDKWAAGMREEPEGDEEVVTFARGWSKIPDTDKRAIVNMLVEVVEVEVVKPERGANHQRIITGRLRPWAEDIKRAGEG